MRLGFWNRLALVAWVIGTLALPTWWVLSTNARHSEVMQSGYRKCLAAANESSNYESRELCWDLWVEGARLGFMGWGAWWEGLGWAAIGLGILYAIIRLCVSVAKWVWQGRAVIGQPD